MIPSLSLIRFSAVTLTEQDEKVPHYEYELKLNVTNKDKQKLESAFADEIEAYHLLSTIKKKVKPIDLSNVQISLNLFQILVGIKDAQGQKLLVNEIPKMEAVLDLLDKVQLQDEVKNLSNALRTFVSGKIIDEELQRKEREAKWKKELNL